MNKVKITRFWTGAILMCLALVVGVTLSATLKTSMTIWLTAFVALFIPGFILLGLGVISDE